MYWAMALFTLDKQTPITWEEGIYKLSSERDKDLPDKRQKYVKQIISVFATLDILKTFSES